MFTDLKNRLPYKTWVKLVKSDKLYNAYRHELAGRPAEYSFSSIWNLRKYHPHLKFLWMDQEYFEQEPASWAERSQEMAKYLDSLMDS